MNTEALVPELLTVGLTVHANDQPASVGFVADVTVKEHGVPTVTQPVFTITGSGPFSTLLCATAVPPPLQPGPGTAQAGTVAGRRPLTPSALHVFPAPP